MKTSKILAIISFLSGIIFIINGTGSETFYYESNLDEIATKSFVLIPFILAMALGVIALILIIKDREATPLFILLALLGIIMGGLVFLPHWAKSKSALRQSELAKIAPIMELCYEGGKYPEIEVRNGYVENKAICGSPMPGYPIVYESILDKNFIKTTPFKGISNSNNRDKYCIYASVPEREGEFFTLSQQGFKVLEKEPTSLDDCY
jgi:hypothetical protein